MQHIVIEVFKEFGLINKSIKINNFIHWNLINITDDINDDNSQNNSFNIHLKSQIPFQEISSNTLEFDNQVIQNPVFNNYTFSNVSIFCTNETYCWLKELIK